MSTAVSPRPEWSVPPHLKPYLEYTNYPDRTEELHNADTSPFVNAPLHVMHVETTAQMDLLARLHAAGLLKEAPGA